MKRPLVNDQMTAVQVTKAVRKAYTEVADHIMAWLQSGMTWDDVLYALSKEQSK